MTWRQSLVGCVHDFSLCRRLFLTSKRLSILLGDGLEMHAARWGRVYRSQRDVGPPLPCIAAERATISTYSTPLARHAGALLWLRSYRRLVCWLARPSGRDIWRPSVSRRSMSACRVDARAAAAAAYRGLSGRSYTGLVWLCARRSGWRSRLRAAE